MWPINFRSTNPRPLVASLSAALLLASGVFLQACGGGGGGSSSPLPPLPPPPPPPPTPPSGTIVGPTGGTAMSADGLVTMAIPAGALPADTDIVITKLMPSEIPGQFAGADAVYDFAPDGLQFAVPAQVTTTSALNKLPDGTVEYPLTGFLHLSAGSVETLSNHSVDVDLDMAQSATTATIEHFSQLAVLGLDLAFRTRDKASARVGESFVIPYDIFQLARGSAGDVNAGIVMNTQEDIKPDPTQTFDLFPAGQLQPFPSPAVIPLDSVGDRRAAAVDGVCIAEGSEQISIVFRTEFSLTFQGIDENFKDAIVTEVLPWEYVLRPITVTCTEPPPPPTGPSQELIPTGSKPDGLAKAPADFLNTPDDKNVVAVADGAIVQNADTGAVIRTVLTGGEERVVGAALSNDASLIQQNSGLMTGSNFNSKLTPSNLTGSLKVRSGVVPEVVTLGDTLYGVRSDENTVFRVGFTGTGEWEYLDSIGGSLQGGANFFPGASEPAISYAALTKDLGFVLSMDGKLSLGNFMNITASDSGAVLANALRIRADRVNGVLLATSFEDAAFNVIRFDTTGFGVTAIGPVVEMGAENNMIGIDVIADGDVTVGAFAGQNSGNYFHIEIDPNDLENTEIRTTQLDPACVMPSHTVIRKLDNDTFQAHISCNGSSNLDKLTYTKDQLTLFSPSASP